MRQTSKATTSMSSSLSFKAIQYSETELTGASRRAASSGMWYLPLNSFLTSLKRPRKKRSKIATEFSGRLQSTYYQRLEDCPAYAAVALHPRYRWRYFETKWSTRESWITDARAAVQRLWDSDYKKRPISNQLTTFRPLQFKASFVSPFDQYSDTVGPSLMPDLDEPKDLPDDEYERWQLSTATTDIDVEDPLEYWYNKRSEYPRLCQMALRAGVIHDSVMDVPDLDTKNHREEGLDPVKDDNEESGDDTGAVSPPEDGDGDREVEVEVEVVTLYD
ncbi:hypothetical protein V1524DRAFT_439417 [Lipomyces starkeyi]